MAKKGNAIYAPGELNRVRNKLGVDDPAEAKRMAQMLGGEVGTERNDDSNTIKKDKKSASIGKGKKAGRRVDIAESDEESSISKSKSKNTVFPGDDPSVPSKLSYRERVKIDQYSGQLAFEIKNSIQVIQSIFSFFKEPVDYVNPRFITLRLNEYYAKIERLVTATRNLFPKGNNKRDKQLKMASPFVYKILDVLRSWNIEQIAVDIAELQARPRSVIATNCAEVLRYIYKPIFILDELNIENIKIAFKLIYKILYIESPIEAKDKYQIIIRNIISSLMDIRKTVQFGLYPLLMKLISDRYIPYERFFVERRRRYMAFLIVTESEQLKSTDLAPQQIDNLDVETLQKNLSEDDSETDETVEAAVSDGQPPEEGVEEDPDDPKANERKSKEDALKADQKALERGRITLETLFPKAGWDKLEECPDIYPYFANLYSMKHGYELIAASDPIQQVAVLMHILDDLFIGLRYISFGAVRGADGAMVSVHDELSEIINNWRRYIEDSFSKDYLPRLSEYCRMLENSEESRTSPYARKTMNELHWIKRLYFLPYYKFESMGPPPFPKQDIIPVYSLVRKIRKMLTAVALGIEQGVRSSESSPKAQCEGINNPWDNYNFQVPNPVSKRLDLLLTPERKNNATLIFFTLSAVTVLDQIINNDNSWAYGNRPGPLFRSVKNEGITPVFGVDEKLNADQIFKESLKKKA
jgi:hypothetical protein